MKASIVLVSVLIAVATWWWHKQPRHIAGKTTPSRLQVIFKSIVAGIVTYFTLMAIAMLYLLVTTA